MESQSGGEYHYESTFMFLDPSDFEILIGVTMLVTSTFEQTSLDMQMSNPERMMSLMGLGMTEAGAEITEKEPLPGMVDIGDSSAGMTMLVETEGMPMRMDIVIFRQGDLVGMLMLIYDDTFTPSVSLPELGQILDQRIIEVQESVP